MGALKTRAPESGYLWLGGEDAAPVVASWPRYDRESLKCGIAHLGVGGFHRAHQALFLHEYLQDRAEDWMIFGVGCLDADRDLIDDMRSQGNVFTLTESFGSDANIKLVGSIKEMVHAPSDPQRVIDVLASDDIKIISMTVTEKGYCYNRYGNLDLYLPAIQNDLLPGSTPRTALGYLFAAADARMRFAGQPFTVLSCDNLPGNGDMTRELLLEFADAKDFAVADWIRQNVTFPNSMVDRITPAVTPYTREFVRSRFGIADKCAVLSEPFCQWIIEDDFVNGRPQLEQVGVRFVESVEPYEKLKMRMLNGSHSALAYVSYLMGYGAVDLAVSDETISEFISRLMDENIIPAVPAVPGIDVSEYKAALLERFANPAISDQVERLGEDGSKKVRNFLVPVIEHQLATGGSVRWLAFAIAAWYRYLRGIDEHGRMIELNDPMAEELNRLARKNPNDPVPFLSVMDIFGSRLSSNVTFVSEMTEMLDAINLLGTGEALKKYLQQ